jgi:hypothetical protein
VPRRVTGGGLGMASTAMGGTDTHGLLPKSSRDFFALAMDVLPPIALADAVLRRVLRGRWRKRACVVLQPISYLFLRIYIDHDTAAEMRGHVCHQLLPCRG